MSGRGIGDYRGASYEGLPPEGAKPGLQTSDKPKGARSAEQNSKELSLSAALGADWRYPAFQTPYCCWGVHVSTYHLPVKHRLENNRQTAQEKRVRGLHSELFLIDLCRCVYVYINVFWRDVWDGDDNAVRRAVGLCVGVWLACSSSWFPPLPIPSDIQGDKV